MDLTAAADGEQQESEGDSSDDTQDKRELDDTEASSQPADVELEAQGPSADDGTGIERTKQVLVEKPPGTG